MSLIHPRTIVLNPKYHFLRDFVHTIPEKFNNDEGTILYKGRNELRIFNYKGTDYVVKSFCTPHLINRFVYGFFRPSKAERSYQYAALLRSKNIGSPEPVAWITIRNGLLLDRSYYVSVKSECPYTYKDLIGGKFPDQEKFLRAIARTTATFHENGMIHKDYSRGNILFGEKDNRIMVEIIDLNRIRFYKSVSLEEGCRNFAERLPATPEMRQIMAEEYARARGANTEECYQLMVKGNNCNY